jgi:putative ABC transport system permease protein
MNLISIALRGVTQRKLASALTMFSMALGVTMVVAVLTIHGIVSESFQNNSSLGGYNMLVGPKGGKLQLVLNSIFYLDKPFEPLPYDYYLEFKNAAQREAEYEDSLRRAGLEAQDAALQLAAQSDLSGLNGVGAIGLVSGDRALQRASDKAFNYQRAGEFSVFTAFAIPLCLGDYYGKFRVVGTTPEFFEYLKELDPARNKKLEFAEGRAFERFNDQHGWYEAVVGSQVARAKNLKVGDVVNPAHGDPEGHTHGQGFTIVGILKPTGSPHDRAVYVNLDGFYLMDGHAKPLEAGDEEEGDAAPATSDDPSKVKPKLKWPEPLPIEQREVSAMLVRTSNPIVTIRLVQLINEGRTAQAVLPIEEITNLLERFVAPFRYLLLILTAMICVVSGISVLVSIYNSMSERRRDIAVMRALGASQKTIFAIIITESIILSVGGTLIGMLAAHTLNAAAAPRIEDLTGVQVGFLDLAPAVPLSSLMMMREPLRWDPNISPEIVVVLAMVVLAMIVGTIPAISAYRTDVSRSLAP